MFKLVNRLIALYIFLLFTSLAVHAENKGDNPTPPITLAELKSMNHEVYSEPWLSYKKIVKQPSDSIEASKDIKIWWLLRKAQCENLLYFYSKFDQTLIQLFDLVDKTSSLEVQARLYYFKGLSSQRSGEYKLSREFLQQAMDVAKINYNHHIYVQAKLEQAYTYSLEELFVTSLKDMQEAYVDAFALNDDFLIAMINEAYGAIYGYMLDYEKSLEYYQKALDSYESIGYQAHAAEAIYGMASTYRYGKKYALAIDKFTLYQQKVSYTPNSNLSYFGAYGLGMTLAEQGSCEEALDVIQEALILKGLVDYDAELYKRKASCLIQLGRYNEAENALDKVNTLFDTLPEISGTAWQLEVIKISSSLAYARGNFDEGYQLLASYYQQYTALLIENSSARVITVRHSMEVERKNIENALSNQRSKSELLEIKTRQQKSLQQTYFIIFLLTLLAIFFAVVTVQFKNNRKMSVLSITDSLSGLYNRRYIFSFLDKLIAGTSKDKGQLSIFVIDIDDFKKINDTHGHPVGDHIIEMLAKIAQQTLRTEDVVGRIGGEEFLCVLPRANLVTSEKIALRMKNVISEYAFHGEEGIKISVTISIGVACMTPDISTSKSLYGLADKALYSAKNAGKNNVKVF